VQGAGGAPSSQAGDTQAGGLHLAALQDAWLGAPRARTGQHSPVIAAKIPCSH